jgi:hypothetical protein
MNLLPHSEESLIQRVASILFPPKLTGTVGLSTAEYHERMSRTGMDHVPGMAVGRVYQGAREKRVILLSGRTSF